MQKKILLDLERLRYPNSGIANVFRGLAFELYRLDTKSNISVFGSKEYLEKIGIELPIVATKPIHKWFCPFLRSFALVHVSHQLSSYFHATPKECKKVITLHDLNFLHENIPPQKKKKLLQRVRKNIKNADVIVCISEFVRQDFLKNKHLFEFKRQPQVAVIYNGIQLPNRDDFQEIKPSSFTKNKYILNIGVLFEKKNQLSIIEMLPFITQDLILVFSDEKSDYVNTIKNRIDELGISDRVYFLKNVTEQQKLDLLHNCDALIHPSLAEGFGIPPIEAMSLGKPVFLSKCTSLPEIGGDVAYYFDSFDPSHMQQLFKAGMHDHQQNNRSSQSIEQSKKFSLEIAANKYLNLYETILQSIP